MADNKLKKGRPDRDRINVGEDCEVRYWAETFVVTGDELKEAVRRVGPMAEDIAKHPGKVSPVSMATPGGGGPLIHPPLGSYAGRLG